jgi:tetratricopeptide (TPR) repeat protein
MSVIRLSLTALIAAVLAAWTQPDVQAQECVGSKPSGSTWVRSADQHLSVAARTPMPDEKRSRYEQTLRALAEGMQRQPDNPRHYELAGIAYAAMGDLVGADTMWAKAEHLWSCYAVIDTLRYNEAARAFQRGTNAASAGELAEAEEHLQLAHMIYFALPHPLLELGDLYAQQALMAATDEEQATLQEKAIESYRQALATIELSTRLSEEESDQYRRNVTLALAHLYGLRGDYERASEAWDTYLAEQPGNIQARSNAAAVMVLWADQTEDAAAELDDGPEKEALLTKTDSLRAEANDFYAELLARDDLDAHQYAILGAGLTQIRRYDDASVAYGKALALSPYHFGSLEQLVLVLFYAGSYDNLIVSAHTMAERYPLNTNAWSVLYNAYYAMEETDSALAAYEQHEAVKVELLDFELIVEGANHTLKGVIHNIGGEQGSSLDLVFDFYDEAGQQVTSVGQSLEVPEPGGAVRFSIEVESSVPIAGFAYRLPQEETGTR